MTSPTEQQTTSFTRARWMLLAYFFAILALIPATQLITELRRGEPIQELDVLRAPPSLRNFETYERALEDNSVVAEPVGIACRWASLRALRVGNEKAVIGKRNTIFFRPSLDALIAPGFMSEPNREGHPVRAIVAFRDALLRHGVQLALFIVPGKETIYPEWLSGRFSPTAGPPANPDMPAFLAEMERRGIRAIDPTDALWRARRSPPLYLAQDTHWTPTGLAIAADELARRLPTVEAPPRNLRALPTDVTRLGDLYDMLKLAHLPTAFAPERVTIQRVVDADTGVPIEPNVDAPILLLGDSFTNIYSLAGMGWGDHAGLAEQLALRLGRDIDVIAQNDGGVNTTRATLARLPAGVDGKRLVIWQFAARDLVVSNGDWKIIDIASR